MLNILNVNISHKFLGGAIFANPNIPIVWGQLTCVEVRCGCRQEVRRQQQMWALCQDSRLSFFPLAVFMKSYGYVSY